MINPCPTHVLCPPGTGQTSDGFNYSSEYIEVRSYPGISYPNTPYGYYTACQGRCISLISQEDANLCAQRQAKICQNDGGLTQGGPGGGPGSGEPTLPTYGNDPQICTISGTGTTVIIPADVFLADSKAEANAQALSYANNLQVQPVTPPGVTVGPGPDTPKLPINPPNVIPKKPERPPPKPPPTSQCKPCDDSTAVFAFSLNISIPADTSTLTLYSPLLKCGKWRFTLTTNDPGSIDDSGSYIVGYLVAGDPSHTMILPGALSDCPQLTWEMPCSPDPCPNDPMPDRTVQQMGLLPGCCNTTSTDCGYLECQTLEDGSHWMVKLAIQYSADGTGIGNSAKQFTMNGAWIGPIPPPPTP